MRLTFGICTAVPLSAALTPAALAVKHAGTFHFTVCGAVQVHVKGAFGNVALGK